MPISPVLRRNRDKLVAGDIIRNVKFLKFLPEIEIYDKLIDALEKRGGYQGRQMERAAGRPAIRILFMFSHTIGGSIMSKMRGF